MTEPGYDPAADPMRRFRDALPGRVRNQLSHTARLTVLVHRAVRDHGWTVEQLVAEATRDWHGAVNVGGIINHRLENIDGPPDTRTGLHRTHFGCCEDGWIYDETGDPPRQTKCPGNRPAEVNV